MKKTEQERLEQRIRERFVKAFVTYHLLEDDDHILVGLSGGKDSLCLLDACKTCQDRPSTLSGGGTAREDGEHCLQDVNGVSGAFLQRPERKTAHQDDIV